MNVLDFPKNVLIKSLPAFLKEKWERMQNNINYLEKHDKSYIILKVERIPKMTNAAVISIISQALYKWVRT